MSVALEAVLPYAYVPCSVAREHELNSPSANAGQALSPTIDMLIANMNGLFIKISPVVRLFDFERQVSLIETLLGLLPFYACCRRVTMR